MVFTGHSLGHIKRQRLLEQGARKESIESQYHMAQRIEAEETALDNAIFVVASTQQEVDEQYSVYDNHHQENMVVIPPGIDLERFHPLTKNFRRPAVYNEIARFFKDEKKRSSWPCHARTSEKISVHWCALMQKMLSCATRLIYSL